MKPLRLDAAAGALASAYWPAIMIMFVRDIRPAKFPTAQMRFIDLVNLRQTM